MLALGLGYLTKGMHAAANITQAQANLKVTAILDFEDRDLSALAESRQLKEEW
jgi:hypothetical protein